MPAWRAGRVMNRSRWDRVGALVLALLVAGGVVWAVRARTQPAARYYHFTRDAQRILQRAQEEATRHGHRYIDTSHLLAAFLTEPRGGVGLALRAGDLMPEWAGPQLQALLAAEDRRVDEEIGLTPAAKRVVEESAVVTQRFGGGDVRVEHLLLGLISSTDTAALRPTSAESLRPACCAARGSSCAAGADRGPP